ncbi:hypothetical protein GGR53DRAFT_489321 [Hypoxylon sp. FL1150]|nr:hypothetical protein GGR53DRAFT_489321 [Hypoxylon sp. FL1150]
MSTDISFITEKIPSILGNDTSAMDSQDTSPQPPGDAAPINGSSDILACSKHNRHICPPCLFNCQVVDLSFSVPSLALEDGAQAYLSWPDQLLFNWSETRPDLKKLEFLADLTRANPYDNYTVAENGGWYPLFVPQFDEQVQGVFLWDNSRRWRFTTFKIPAACQPDFFETVCCADCHQLTWLKGGADEEGGLSFHSHPRHQTLSTVAAAQRFLDVRSLLVYVDGILLPRRKHTAGPVAGVGIGVFFGKDSKYNLSETLAMEPASKQRAEIVAAGRAMDVLKNDIIGAWAGQLKKAGQEEGINHIRLIIATSSADLVDTFTRRIRKWEWDRETQCYYKPGEGHGTNGRIKNSDVVRAVSCQIEDMERGEIGVETVWYHVDKEYSAEARYLAKAAAGSPAS